MHKVIFTIDVEPDLHTDKYVSIVEGLKIAEIIFDKYNIKPILFVTCDCIERYPEIFKRLNKKGWEIALHGYRHVRFDDLTTQEKEEQIKKAINCFRKYLKIKPKGFRAPQHSIDDKTLDLLEKYGFEYDSSYTSLNLLQIWYFPRKLKLGLKHFFSPRNPYLIRGKLVEMPPAALLFPFVSLACRIFPITFLKIFIRVLSVTHKKIVFYCHSWDLIDTPTKKISKIWLPGRFTKKLEQLCKLTQTYRGAA